jgi:predicted O-methyltransferase YrrM
MARAIGGAPDACEHPTREALPAVPAHAPEPSPFIAPGHYLSPLPDIADVEGNAHHVWPDRPRTPEGVDLSVDRQLAVHRKLEALVRDGLYRDADERVVRYHSRNGMFEPSNAVELSAMIRLLEPRRIVEVGSGFTSAVMLDTNEHFLNHRVELTFIEPQPERLRTILRTSDAQRARIVEAWLRDVDRSEFTRLEAGDVFFVDSSHVLKIRSDVQQILFEILPSLKPGVFIHFHDIFYPFEYPKRWVLEGRAWNEAYGVHAFLQYNASFSIYYWASFLAEEMRAAPLNESRTPFGSSSLWLRRDR